MLRLPTFASDTSQHGGGHVTVSRLLAILIACLWWPLQAVVTAGQQPNVVLILADDLGWADLGFQGSQFHLTPHLDALSRRGMRFTNAYAASPLCSPTRASILTGLSPARIGITAPVCHLPQVVLDKRLAKGGPAVRVLAAESLTRLKTDYLTLPEVLQAAGWRTAHFGKWHLGSEPWSPLQHGFEIDLPHTPGPGPGGANGYFAPWAFWKGQGQPGDHIEDRMAQEAVEFIAAHKDRPFFLNYWAFSVHSPWMAKADYIAEAAVRADPAAPQRNPLYAGMLRSLDEAVGRIVAALQEHQLSDNTLIVFTSDNGGWNNLARANAVAQLATGALDLSQTPITSNAPLRSGKASNYDGGTRVPLLIVWPGQVPADATSDALVQSTDLFPTILELLQLSRPEDTQLDGISIAPALQGQPLPRDTIFSHFPHGGRNDIDGFRPGTWVRRGPWKLIRFYADNTDGSDRLELYNLHVDIGEAHNVADQHPELVRELNHQIDGFLRDTDAVIPRLNPDYRPAAATVAARPESGTASNDPLLNWKARSCTATVRDGSLQVIGSGPSPFLGFAAGQLAGPAVVTLRVRAADGGAGQIQWLPSPTATNQAQSVPFRIAPGDWHTIEVKVPASGPLGILRVYLPAVQQPVEVDRIQLQAGDQQRVWDF